MNKKSLLFGLAAVTLLTACSNGQDSKTDATNNGKEVTASVTEDIHGDIFLYDSMIDKESNSIISPYGIRDAFHPIVKYAENESKTELNHILEVSDSVTSKYNEYDENAVFDGTKGLMIVNKAYAGKETGAEEIEQINYKNFEETFNKILSEASGRDLKITVPENVEYSSGVLANAIYFSNAWNYEKRTISWNGKDVPAFGGTELPIEQVKEANNHIDVLRIPYDVENGNDYSLYIICDNSDSDTDSVDTFMADTTEDELHDLLDFSEYKRLYGYDSLDFIIPDFSVENDPNLIETLRDIGISSVFSKNTKDFSTIGNLRIDAVYQLSTFSANENGSGVDVSEKEILEDTTEKEEGAKYVRADSPFVFILKDDTTNDIIYMGRIADPSL